jgi:hypothetical protein
MITQKATGSDQPGQATFPDLVPIDALHHGLEALAVLQMLDSIRQLDHHESERVHSEIQRALHRMKSPRALENHLILEDFRVVIESIGNHEPAESTQQTHGITQEELRAYRRAWETISRIHHAAQARAVQEEREWTEQEGRKAA